MSGPLPRPRVPRPLLAVAAVVLVTTVALAVHGAWTTGVSWDEAYHVGRMRSFLAHGWYLLEGDLDGDRPGAWEDQAYVYAPVTAILLHAAVGMLQGSMGVHGALQNEVPMVVMSGESQSMGEDPDLDIERRREIVGAPVGVRC